VAGVRAFLACRVPDGAVRALQTWLAPVRADFAGAALRWVPAANLHLTVRFFGTLPLHAALALRPSLVPLVRGVAPVAAELTESLILPDAQSPRIVAINVEGAQALAPLAKAVDLLCDVRRDHPFQPHVTVLRLVRPGRVLARRVVAAFEQSGSAAIPCTFDRICLYRSDMAAGGARYSPLFELPLHG
jgi:2'-5' RNA ligase